MSAVLEDSSTLRDKQPESNSSLPAEIVSDCELVVEGFRKGSSSKVAAFLQIQGLLVSHNATVSDESAAAALQSYLAILDNIEKFRNPTPPGTPVRPRRDSGGSTGQSLGGDSDSAIDQSARTSKRELSSEADEESGSPTKRRLDIHRLGWTIRSNLNPPALSIELRQTNSLLENYGRDIKLAKSLLVNTPGVPQFPDSEWTNILSGRPVDLDRVISNLYTADTISEHLQQLGSGVKLVTESVPPIKTVSDHSSYTIAWESYVDAVSFAFPHRKGELTTYGMQIKQLFRSIPPERHSRVIQYDKAIRIRVAQRRDLLLTDTSAFSDLALLWLHFPNHSGLPSERGGRSGNAAGGSSRRRDACRRWNEDRCPDSASICKYAHVCSRCRNTGHTIAACTRSSTSSNPTAAAARK